MAQSGRAFLEEQLNELTRAVTLEHVGDVSALPRGSDEPPPPTNAVLQTALRKGGRAKREGEGERPENRNSPEKKTRGHILRRGLRISLRVENGDCLTRRREEKRGDREGRD
jgi:hypothetical protein